MKKNFWWVNRKI